jgi:chaperonin GroEL (HSP60 family)
VCVCVGVCVCVCVCVCVIWRGNLSFESSTLIVFAARKAEYQDALILLTEKKISSVQQIVPALEIALGMKK